MKTFLIIFIVFYQHQIIFSHKSPFDFMAAKINEFVNNVAKTFRDIKENFGRLFKVDHTNYRILNVKPVSQDIERRQKNKEAFNKFIKTKVENPSTEGPGVTTSPECTLTTVTTMAVLRGKQVESHSVTTKDGYILTLHRIVPENYVDLPNKTILLHHGLLGSSADWLLLGPNKSLPYLLSETGYDVWMANARGNYYSHKHITKKPDSVEFWKFTWQDMGEHDLPTVIDYIRLATNTNESISYIGHSMGATALLVLLSTVPIYNKYLKIGVLLAPLAFMTDVKGPLKALSEISTKSSESLSALIGVNGEFLPTRRVPDWLAVKYCKGSKIYCRNPLFFITGGFTKLKPRNPGFLSKLLYHIPAGTSTYTILHYAQLIINGKFHKFDNVTSEFFLRNVTLPIAIISSSEDLLASIPDTVKLYHSIANPIDHEIIRDKNLSHTDFVWGSEADILIFPKILNILENGLKDNATKRNEI